MWIVITVSNHKETLSRILHMPQDADMMQKMIIGRAFFDAMGKNCAKQIYEETKIDPGAGQIPGQA